MAELQGFDMNGQLNFAIPEKSIYQMGFNSGAPATVSSYVGEPNPLTNHLHILEMLNQPNSDADDKKRQFFNDLMAPHYEKQAEIEKKIDDLSEIMHNFIRTQQSVNELVIEKYLRQGSSGVNIVENSPQNLNLAPTTEEVEKMDEQEQNEEDVIINVETTHHQPINNPMPIYPVPIHHETNNSPNRSISPIEKMEIGGSGGSGNSVVGEISVRDFLKNNMTVQKADDKILEMERERDREEAAQTVKYNKFRVRNRPKKYRRSAVTVTSNIDPSTTSSGVPTTSSATIGETSSSLITTTSNNNSDVISQLLQNSEESPRRRRNSTDIHEESAFQPVLVQRPPDLELALMQPVFPTTSSYVLNSSAAPTLSADKFQSDLWKVDAGMLEVTQLLVDAPALLDSDLRPFADHSHHSSFLPFVGNQDHHPRSAFLPPNYQKDRRIQIDPHLTDTLRNL